MGMKHCDFCERLAAIEAKLGIEVKKPTRFEKTKKGQTWKLGDVELRVVDVSGSSLIAQGVLSKSYSIWTTEMWNRELFELVSEPQPKTFASLGIRPGTMVRTPGGLRFTLRGLTYKNGYLQEDFSHLEIADD